MWLSADGVAHTVALPDWRIAVDGGRDRLENLSAADKSTLEAALSEYEDQLFAELEAFAAEPAVEDRFVGRIPPPLGMRVSHLGASFVADVVASIAQADVRWRLDYLLALQDACDEGSGPLSR